MATRKKKPIKKAPAKRKAPARRKAAPKKKAPVKKAAPKKKTPTKKVPAKKAAPKKKAPVKKAAPKKKPVKKAAPKKKAPVKRKPSKPIRKKAPVKRPIVVEPAPIVAPEPKRPSEPAEPKRPSKPPKRPSRPPRKTEPVRDKSILEEWKNRGGAVQVVPNEDGSTDYEVYYPTSDVESTLLDFEIDLEAISPDEPSVWLQAAVWFSNRDMSAERRKATDSVPYGNSGLWVRWSNPTTWERRGNVLELIRTWARNPLPGDTVVGWSVRIWSSPYEGDYPMHFRGED